MFYGVPGGLSGSGWGTQDSNGVWSGWANAAPQQVAAYDPGAGAAFGGAADAYMGDPGAYAAQMPAPMPVQQPTFGGAPASPMQGQGIPLPDTYAGGSRTFNGGPGGLGGGAYQPGIANDPMGGGSVGANPYMSGQIGFLGDATNRLLQRGLQGIRSNAVGTGNLGSSRQGIAEGTAIADAVTGFGGNVANMLGQNYMQDRALNTQSYATHRGLDLQQAGLGLNAMNNGLNMQWTPLMNANSVYTPFTGLGTQSTPAQGGGWQGALGSGISTAALLAQLGLFK